MIVKSRTPAPMCHIKTQPFNKIAISAVQLPCRRTIGNKTVSLIDSPVNAINNLSIPIPVPVEGGIAYSNAARKSSSSSHCLIVARGRRAGLGFEPFALDNRVDEFGVAGRQLDASDIEIPFLGDTGHAAMLRGSEALSRPGKSLTKVGAQSVFSDGVFPQFLDQFPVPVTAVAGNLDIRAGRRSPISVRLAYPA